MVQTNTRELKKEVESAGLTLLSADKQRSGHYKLVVKRDDGETKLFFTSSTSSDFRTSKNRISLYRQFAREVTT